MKGRSVRIEEKEKEDENNNKKDPEKENLDSNNENTDVDLESSKEEKEEEKDEKEELKDIIFDLRIKLKIAEYKNKLYEEILKNSSFNLDFFTLESTGIKIDWKTGSIPVYISDFVKEHPVIKVPKIAREKQTDNKPKFRKAKTITNEEPEKQEENIRNTETYLRDLSEKYGFNINAGEIRKNIKLLFKDIEESRAVKQKTLQEIKNCRAKLLGTLSVKDYIEQINKDISQLESIIDKRKKDTKQKLAWISSTLSPLDQRLIFYGQYYNTEISLEELERFGKAVEYHIPYYTRYIPYSDIDLYDKFHNYTLALNGIGVVLKRALKNPNKFYNLVYVENGKSTKEDPFTFYVLTSLSDKGERRWTLEVRLYDFSIRLAESIRKYAIALFRRIYFSVFNDNHYREDYVSKATIFSKDCQQLLNTLCTVSNQNHFCKVLQKYVKKICTIIPTQMDKFDYVSDNSSIKKLLTESVDKNVYLKLAADLFDEIEEKEAIAFFNNLI